jgi:hypothetical protein
VFVDKTVPLVSDASDRLSELKPPQDEQRIADAWNKANSDIVRALERLRDAAKAKDRAKMNTALADGNKANSRADTLAKTLGMNACAGGRAAPPARHAPRARTFEHLLIWILVAIWLIVLPGFAARAALNRGRSVVGAIILTVLLGPIGLAIVLLMSRDRRA